MKRTAFGGIRRYVLIVLDHVSAVAFAVALPSKHARHTVRVAQALVAGLPQDTARKIQFLPDNGSEFKGVFDKTLQRQSLTHYWTYPKSPKMNAHAERFHRPLPESFVGDPEGRLFTDLGLFNR